MKEAMFYEKVGDKRVRCTLCPHRCVILDSKRGICGVRENKGGVLYSLVYGRLVARAVDPIEKKPLFHFLPGTEIYSIATVGCNLRCLNCQNYAISQAPKEGGEIFGGDFRPEEVVSEAKRYRCRSLAYTYTEPTVFFEFAYDVAKLASGEGMKNAFITNGYIAEEPLKEISPYLDAANIDLKGFRDEFYLRNCGARLEPVLKAIKLYKRLGIWIELTTLIIPGMNDSEDELRQIAQFIKEEVGPETPWHVTQFYPMYKLSHLYSTPLETLKRAREIGLESGLRYVYTGNVPGYPGENTYCYSCGKLLIRRYGYEILEYKIKDSKCPYCGARIDGVGL